LVVIECQTKELKVTEPGNDAIRDEVRKRYAEVARSAKTGCGCAPSSCCGGAEAAAPEKGARQRSCDMGYSTDEIAAVPEGADMGLGCGNPQAIAALKTGEAVLDLGCGAGLDCFLAAGKVGPTGRVIGVDMTPDMISAARANARKSGLTNVEFRLGEIEHLPVADACVDAIISNCVINLSTDKQGVFRDAYRALRPGGRIAIFDIAAIAPLPTDLREDLALYSACAAGAARVCEIEAMLAEAGFSDIRITPKPGSREMISQWWPGRHIEDYVVSVAIEARRPSA